MSTCSTFSVLPIAIASVAVAGVLMLASSTAADHHEKDEQGEAADTPAILKYDVETLKGDKINLAKKYHGKVLLIVNVASKCGYTPQYEGLQKIHEKYADKGLAILGFPCNQFGAQEPGTSDEIAEFCKTNYGVTFDMFKKIDVNGENQSPLYKYLTSEKTNPVSHGPIKWNFEKFLISADGQILKRYSSRVKPASEEMTTDIEAALAARNDS